MKSSSFPLNKLVLLVTTMLFSPSISAAQAQTAPTDEFGDEEEIVVLGRNIPEPMRDTSEVVTVLSAEDLARTGDDNAADALTRLSGLSVVSGRYAYVRGLGDRYSSALLNGSPLPSPEPLRRQVPLDLFPSNILDGATVQKTFSPNFPGEFGGGVIDLRTLRLPNETFLTLKVGTAGNTESTDKRGLTYRGESSDWTGLSDGLRDMPPALAAAIDSGRRVSPANFTAQQLEAIGESLVNSPLTVIQSEHLDPDFEGEVTAGGSFDLGRFNLGLVGVAGYDSSLRTQHAHRQGVVGGVVETDFNSFSTTWDVVFNGFGSASLGWDENAITITGLLVRSSSKDAQIDEGTDANASGTTGLHKESTAWYERQLASLQIAGEHTFGDLDLSWRTAFAQSTRDAPYERDITYDETPLYPIIYSGRTLGNATRFSDLTDEVVSGGVDGSYTIALSQQRDAVFSAGASVSNTVREYNQRTFAFLEASTNPNLIPVSVRVSRPDYLFQPDNIRPDGFQLQEFTGRDDSYRGRLTVNAGYAAADVEILPLVHVAAGVRYEDATEIVRTGNSLGETPFAAPVVIDNQYWLPAGTLTWNFAEDLQLRLGYSQTIARPQFRELAFTPYIDPETDRLYQGNPFLTDTEFKNYDARLEYYFGTNQFVTVGGFYKQVDNPIEEVIVPREGAGTTTRFINAPEATLFGAEVEYRTRFEMPFELPFLTGAEWLFAVNYTYTNSEVSGSSELIVDPTQLPNRVLVPASNFALDGTALQGTPENIANLQFGYETGASQLTLLVGWVDERIARRGLGSLPSVIEDPGVNVDLVYRRDFSVAGTDLTLGLAGRNLLEEDHIEYQQSGAGRTDANTYARGATFSVSLTAKY